MKVTLYMAMSANGFIARENGDEDFLSHENWKKFCELANDFGNFIVGRKTYEIVRDWKENYSFDDLKVDKVIISRDDNFSVATSYTLASSPQDALKKLEARGFKKALLTGGSTINTAFAKANLIDELILNVEPAIIGKGIPLFAQDDFDFPLQLISALEGSKGITTLHYRVKK